VNDENDDLKTRNSLIVDIMDGLTWWSDSEQGDNSTEDHADERKGKHADVEGPGEPAVVETPPAAAAAAAVVTESAALPTATTDQIVTDLPVLPNDLALTRLCAAVSGDKASCNECWIQ
jgi:hypothetical protein